MARREGRIRAHIAFDSKRKFSMIAVEHVNLEGEPIVRVYQKGAPEFVFESCMQYYENKKVFPMKNFKENRINDPDQINEGLMSYENYMKRVLERDMTKDGHRAIAFSYKDFTLKQFEFKNDFQTEEGIKELRSKHNFIGLIALEDPLRDNVKDIMKYIYKESPDPKEDAHLIDVNVRMISGDNLDTAAKMALNAGIL